MTIDELFHVIDDPERVVLYFGAKKARAFGECILKLLDRIGRGGSVSEILADCNMIALKYGGCVGNFEPEYFIYKERWDMPIDRRFANKLVRLSRADND